MILPSFAGTIRRIRLRIIGCYIMRGMTFVWAWEGFVRTKFTQNTKNKQVRWTCLTCSVSTNTWTRSIKQTLIFLEDLASCCHSFRFLHLAYRRITSIAIINHFHGYTPTAIHTLSFLFSMLNCIPSDFILTTPQQQMKQVHSFMKYPHAYRYLSSDIRLTYSCWSNFLFSVHIDVSYYNSC